MHVGSVRFHATHIKTGLAHITKYELKTYKDAPRLYLILCDSLHFLNDFSFFISRIEVRYITAV